MLDTTYFYTFITINQNMRLETRVGQDSGEHKRNKTVFSRFCVKAERALVIVGIAGGVSLVRCQNPALEKKDPVGIREPARAPAPAVAPSVRPPSIDELAKSLEGKDLLGRGEALTEIAKRVENGQALGESKHALINVLMTPDYLEDNAIMKSTFRDIRGQALTAIYHACMRGENVAEAAPALATALTSGDLSPGEAYTRIPRILAEIYNQGGDIDAAIQILAETVDNAAEAQKAFDRTQTDMRIHMSINDLMKAQRRRDLALRVFRNMTKEGVDVDGAISVLKKNKYAFNANTDEAIDGIMARHYLNIGDMKNLLKTLKKNPNMEVINVFFDADAELRAKALEALQPKMKNWAGNGVYFNGVIGLMIYHCVETHQWDKIKEMLANPWTETGAMEGLQRLKHMGYGDEIRQFIPGQI